MTPTSDGLPNATSSCKRTCAPFPTRSHFQSKKNYPRKHCSPAKSGQLALAQPTPCPPRADIVDAHEANNGFRVMTEQIQNEFAVAGAIGQRVSAGRTYAGFDRAGYKSGSIVLR
jgi:hypothetical protein